MSGLHVIIVHAGTEQKKNTAGVSDQHNLTCFRSAFQTSDAGTVRDYCTAVINLSKIDFIFQHSGNPETPDALECWEKRGEKEKVVFFTTSGVLPDRYEDLGIPYLPRMDSADSLLELQWENVPPNFDGNASDLVRLLRPQSAEVLSALSILCQGYLAIHAEEHGEGAEMTKALNQMGWSGDIVMDGANGHIDRVSNPGWWQKPFDGVENLAEEVKYEWGAKENLSRVETLLDWITKGQESLEGKKARKNVATAYCALVQRLGGEPCQ